MIFIRGLVPECIFSFQKPKGSLQGVFFFVCVCMCVCVCVCVYVPLNLCYATDDFIFTKKLIEKLVLFVQAHLYE